MLLILSAALIASILFMDGFLLAQTTVEGQVLRDKANKSDKHPAVNVPITLQSEKMGRSPVVYTNSEGKYYLKDVPPGKYTIQIWSESLPNTKGQAAYLYPIEVSEGQKNKVKPLLVK